MATRVSSPSRKRRSSHKEKQDTKKKRKDSSSSRKDKSKHSNKKTGSSGLKVRTVSELAALVSSGAVRVPQGLEHYVSNRQQLLDQVFTILGPEDVSAMLPDVLQGVKMKRVKALCASTLLSMSEQEILTVIQPTNSTTECGPSQTTTAQSPLSTSRPVEETERGSDEHCEMVKKDSDIVVSDVSEDEKEDTNTKTSAKKCTSSSKDFNNTSEAAVLNATLPNKTTRQKDNERDEMNADEDINAEVVSTDVSQLVEMDLRQRALESALKKATHHHTNATTVTQEETVDTVQCWEEEDAYSTVLQVERESQAVDSVQCWEEEDAYSTVLQVELESQAVDSDCVRAAGELVEQRLREKLLLSLAAKRQ